MDALTSERHVVNLLPPKDISAAAFSTAYVNMKNYRHVDFVISVGANGAGTKAVTLKEAQDVSGTSAATLVPVIPNNHYYSNVAALASASIDNDQMARVALSSGTFNIIASTNNQQFVVPVDASILNNSSSMTHIGIGIATTSAASLVGAIAILSDPRYAQDVPPTAID